MLIPAGLPREQVVERIGKPTKSFKHEQKEIMAYEWNSAYDAKIGGMWSYVILTNGFVQDTLEQAEQQPSAASRQAQADMFRALSNVGPEIQKSMAEQQAEYTRRSKETQDKADTERRHQETIRALKGQQY